MDELSRSGLEYAKRLIQAGQRDKAAAVLRTVEDQLAQSWLKKLDARTPEARKKDVRRVGGFPISWFALGFGIGLLWSIVPIFFG